MIYTVEMVGVETIWGLHALTVINPYQYTGKNANGNKLVIFLTI